jgi:hypothetical protein
LQGEVGRYYRIETSTNLARWLAEPDFPMDLTTRSYPYPKPLTSIIFPASFPTLLSVSATNMTKYVRASRYAPSNEVCNLLLKQIRHAKDVWAREKRVTLTESVGDTDIFGLSFPKPLCPSGAFYAPGKVGSPPLCGYGHILEEPR